MSVSTPVHPVQEIVPADPIERHELGNDSYARRLRHYCDAGLRHAVSPQRARNVADHTRSVDVHALKTLFEAAVQLRS